MGNFFHVIEIGTEILAAIASLGTGGSASIPFSWKGVAYTISVARSTPTP